MEKIKISRPIIVEGKYDKIKLQSILDADIITTDGFGIFSNGEKTALIRALAAPGGVIVLTDSDGAGKLIRSKLLSVLPKDSVTNLYIPQIQGKEKRKTAPSKEGTLGVEGMEAQLLRDIFAPLADQGVKKNKQPVTKQDFYLHGLSGGENSRELRDALAQKFSLPRGMSANALLAAINIISDLDGYERALKAISVKGSDEFE
jgi:ribonuclease M5